MLTSYSNRATDVHQHDYRTEHRDGSGLYQICQSCGFRRHKRVNPGIGPYRPWWVKGENWERSEGTEMRRGLKLSEPDMEPPPKKRGWPKGKPRKQVLTPPTQKAP